MNPRLRSKLRSIRNELRNIVYNRFTRPHLYCLANAERVGVVYHEPSDMCPTDKILLYALVRGLRPERALEIGVRWGGSARIMSNAMGGERYWSDSGVGPRRRTF